MSLVVSSNKIEWEKSKIYFMAQISAILLDSELKTYLKYTNADDGTYSSI